MAVFAIPLFRAESKARQIAMHLSSLNESQWKQVFEDGAQLYAKHAGAVEKDSVRVPLDELSPALRELGFDYCALSVNEVYFSFGSGHMVNSAMVQINVKRNDKYEQPAGVYFHGWRDARRMGYVYPGP